MFKVGDRVRRRAAIDGHDESFWFNKCYAYGNSRTGTYTVSRCHDNVVNLREFGSVAFSLHKFTMEPPIKVNLDNFM